MVPTVTAGPFQKPTSAEARSHLALGNKLYGVRSFGEAALEYKTGALIESAPVFDYNLGQCYRQLGKYQEALWHYERFLAHGNPQGELLDAVNNFITQMKSELDKKALTQKPTEPGPSPIRQPASARTAGETWYEDRLGWGLAGAGVVGLAAAGGLFINAANLAGDANASTSARLHDQLQDKAHERTLLGAVVSVGSTGLLVSGIIKLAFHSETRQQVATWGVATSRNHVIVFGQF